MAEPNFIVASLPRTGSTAVFRVLGSDPGVRIAYEPDFEDSWQEPEKLRDRCRSLFSSYRGIKHVWDPNGWPFTNRLHISTLDVLNANRSLVDINVALLGHADKILFLRRRNQVARVVSDLLGQQTNLWVHNPDRPHSLQEISEYRERLHTTELMPLNEEVISWYVANAYAQEQYIIEHLSEAKRRIVFYEDLFNEAVPETLPRWQMVADWLEVSPDFTSGEVLEVIHPRAKYNDQETYRKIPNLAAIMSKFGITSEML